MKELFLMLIATIYIAPHASEGFAYVIALTCLLGIAVLEFGLLP